MQVALVKFGKAGFVPASLALLLCATCAVTASVVCAIVIFTCFETSEASPNFAFIVSVVLPCATPVIVFVCLLKVALFVSIPSALKSPAFVLMLNTLSKAKACPTLQVKLKGSAPTSTLTSISTLLKPSFLQVNFSVVLPCATPLIVLLPLSKVALPSSVLVTSKSLVSTSSSVMDSVCVLAPSLPFVTLKLVFCPTLTSSVVGVGSPALLIALCSFVAISV